MNLLPRLTIFLTAIIVAVACGNANADSAAPNICGPYGDPSAAVFSGVKPNCGRGKLLGPWKDADRIDRYACLYAPARRQLRSQTPYDRIPASVTVQRWMDY